MFQFLVRCSYLCNLWYFLWLRHIEFWIFSHLVWCFGFEKIEQRLALKLHFCFGQMLFIVRIPITQLAICLWKNVYLFQGNKEEVYFIFLWNFYINVFQMTYVLILKDYNDLVFNNQSPLECLDIIANNLPMNERPFQHVHHHKLS